ncbi:MAG: short-chain dehydrogenase [Bacteroidetes bacterium]|nr:MAG: short-chain dehydrogenase [Bacteroidota bacterium]
MVKNTVKKKRTRKKQIELYHSYYKRTGLYKFLGINFIKLILMLVGIIVLILVLDQIVDFKLQQDRLQHFVDQHNPFFVFTFFLLTESFMGFIPPDIFMVWGRAKFPENAYLIVGVLGTLSYIGGINAYFLGVLIRRFPTVEKFIQRKYGKNFELIEKWGGIVIIMAALFPLPFAMISTIAGIVKYPFRTFLLYGLTRYIRFFLYAVVIFGAIKSFI